LVTLQNYSKYSDLLQEAYNELLNRVAFHPFIAFYE
jgi:hypothetical protein